MSVESRLAVSLARPYFAHVVENWETGAAAPLAPKVGAGFLLRRYFRGRLVWSPWRVFEAQQSALRKLGREIKAASGDFTPHIARTLAEPFDLPRGKGDLRAAVLPGNIAWVGTLEGMRSGRFGALVSLAPQEGFETIEEALLSPLRLHLWRLPENPLPFPFESGTRYLLPPRASWGKPVTLFYDANGVLHGPPEALRALNDGDRIPQYPALLGTADDPYPAGAHLLFVVGYDGGRPYALSVLL